MRKLAALLSLVLICTLLLGIPGLSAFALEDLPADPAACFVHADDGSLLLSDGGELVLDTSGRLFDAPDDNYRVFYEIFTGSFSDSDGDGVGDLRGVINRMDYLNDGDPGSGLSLGVEGIWLTPVFASPSYHKYDVTDYYRVDEQFGTLEDLRELIDLCHARGVKLILDLPINHSGDENEWFNKFKLAHMTGNDENPYYDFYSFVRSEDGSGVPAGFNRIGKTKDYYECNFSEHMPEFNFDSEAVRQEMLSIARFYLDMGVDGFRFDAAKYIYFGDNGRSSEFWDWYLAELRAIKPDIYTVAEVWDADGVTDVYYSAVNCFDFTTSQTSGLIAATAQKGSVGPYVNYVDAYLDRIHAIRPDAMIVPFIANHDTDRASGYLTVASGAMKVAANLYILSSGSPFLYYGEELGLRGSRGGSNTDANRRLAMLWGDGDGVRDPFGTTYDPAKQIQDTAADQKANAYSLYSYYKKLLMIRAAYPAIARGEYTPVVVPDSKLGGFIADWDGMRVCVLHNTTLSSAKLDLAALGLGDFTQLGDYIGVEDASLSDGVLRLGSQTSAVLVG